MVAGSDGVEDIPVQPSNMPLYERSDTVVAGNDMLVDVIVVQPLKRYANDMLLVARLVSVPV